MDHNNHSIIIQVTEAAATSDIREESTSSNKDTKYAPQKTKKKAKEKTTIEAVKEVAEKSLTLFALRLAVLEKAATSIGTLGFIWATVVLLGGFSNDLKQSDFWFVTVILVIDGARIFGRSHELELQHQTTWSLTDVGINSFNAMKSSSDYVITKIKTLFCNPKSGNGNEIRNERKKVSFVGNKSRRQKLEKESTRQGESSEVPVFPVLQWIFLSKNISKFLYWIQLVSATTCVVLSMWKLVRRDFGVIEEGNRNRNQALIIFYSLALADAACFLLEKGFFEWKIRVERLLEKVNNECELGYSCLPATTRFFYDSYSKCITGSIFDGLKMDMVSFAIELMESDSLDEQRVGVTILRKFSTNPKFSNYTIPKIGVQLPVIARLLEMLNWKNEEEEEIRYSAAEILSNLAERKRNPLRIAEIPGALESISSLLNVSRSNSGVEKSDKRIILDGGRYSTLSFHHLGLEILWKIARDPDICGKIGNTRGLLTKIIAFLDTEDQFLWQIDTAERSLQLLQRLASTSGKAGKQLRKDILEIVFTVSYIGDILKDRERYPDLQLPGIQILNNLTNDEEANGRIGATGGVLKVLFRIFFNDNVPNNPDNVRETAGEALATLAHSMTTCHRILELQHDKKLVKALNDPLLRVNAARILRNLCAYSGDDSFQKLKGLTDAVPTVLNAIMEEENKVQEVMLGAAARLFKLLNKQEYTRLFQRAVINKFDLVQRLASILKKYRHPSIKVPGLRRYTLELAIWLMENDSENIASFRRVGLPLESILDTTSELESFHIFSGSVGIFRHQVEMHSLVRNAMVLLKKKKPTGNRHNKFSFLNLLKILKAVYGSCKSHSVKLV